MAEGDESPWFPGSKVYRQGVDGDWGTAFRALIEDLGRALGGGYPGFSMRRGPSPMRQKFWGHRFRALSYRETGLRDRRGTKGWILSTGIRAPINGTNSRNFTTE